MKIDIRVIYGKNELKPEENNWLKSKNSIRTSFCKNLHAKCYMNEKEALITSMNLYEFSQANNNEMGIYVLKENEDKLFNDIYSEASRLIRISDEIKTSVEKVIPKDHQQPKKTKENTVTNGRGHCIRCDEPIALKPLVPYCKNCYHDWKEDGDEDDLLEEFCHICGKEEATSKEKPSCYNCYKTQKDKLEFPRHAK